MKPIRFGFALHLHQPVGNFDHVFEQHVNDVYRPLLERLSARDFFPVVLHLSGPLLEWLESHDSAYLDQLGRLVDDQKVELLMAGFYEPVLVSLPRADRLEQIQWMRDAIHRRFGAQARGLWLTERVWEPELAADLAEAGVRYVLVDDRHFLVSGFAREQLHAPYWTESDGKQVALLPIDERLRYLIPFRPPEEIAAYLRELRQAGHAFAMFADDGEKFGGWPGTKEWVYQRGWLDQFVDTILALVDSGEARLSTLSDALDEVPSAGIAYLPSASYREMEAWSLPEDAALRLEQLERDLGEERMTGPDGSLIRGSHWRNFLVKYRESNRMHKKMQALSMLCRRSGDPAGPRRAIGRAQCNDAYWHGVFGGLYLPHLREAIWRNLAQAERELRRGEALAYEALDICGDGHDEIWIHSDQFSAILSPRRGASLEEYTHFGSEINFANSLTRRREVYLDTTVPFDRDDRAILVDRVLPSELSLGEYATGDYRPRRSWSQASCRFDVEQTEEASIRVVCSFEKPGAEGLIKRFEFFRDGSVRVTYEWDLSAGEPDDLFSTELSLFAPIEVRLLPEAERWSYPIETIAKSERGLDRTRQGESLTYRWPIAVGSASIELEPARQPALVTTGTG